MHWEQEKIKDYIGFRPVNTIGRFIKGDSVVKKISLLMKIVLVSIFLCSCTLEPKPEETIYNLEDALNRYDMDGVLDCYEPSVRDIYDGAMEIGGSIAGFDLQKIVGAAGGIANIFGDDLVEGGMPKVKIDINSQEKISQKEVKMNITIKYEYGDEKKSSMSKNTPTEETMDIYLVLIENTWCISAKSQQFLK